MAVVARKISTGVMRAGGGGGGGLSPSAIARRTAPAYAPGLGIGLGAKRATNRRTSSAAGAGLKRRAPTFRLCCLGLHGLTLANGRIEEWDAEQLGQFVGEVPMQIPSRAVLPCRLASASLARYVACSPQSSFRVPFVIGRLSLGRNSLGSSPSVQRLCGRRRALWLCGPSHLAPRLRAWLQRRILSR